MNNAAFAKHLGNVRKNRNIKLITTDRRRNYFYQNEINTLQRFSEKI